jgi:hypothetical protein
MELLRKAEFITTQPLLLPKWEDRYGGRPLQHPSFPTIVAWATAVKRSG